MVISFAEIAVFEHSSNDPTKQFPVHNPATGEVITIVQGADHTTTERAIARAKHAFDNVWSRYTKFQRSQVLFKCADALQVHREELAELLCMENGKPMQDALMFDVTFLISVFRYFGSLVDKIPDHFYDRGNVYVNVVREPHGVCAGLLPFNWPPIHLGGKTAPALAAGNTMIIKPGEQAPLTVMRAVEILQGVLPEGVLQAVPAVGPEVPQLLCKSDTIKMVSFTGSTATGRQVSKTAAETMKPLALELGGKNAFIVFEDADIERAARDAIEGAFFNKGEACTAASRFIIQDSIYDRFVSKLGRVVEQLKAGNGMKPDTHVGPCITKIQQEKVLNYIEIGKSEGAVVAAEGKLSDDSDISGGYFIKPTLFSNVKREMTIAKEEIFGPVATAISFRDEDEALAIANESSYGLVGVVYTRDSERGFRMLRGLEVGMSWLNNYRRNVLGTPFGGVKDSGHGREHWIETLNEWTTTKTMVFPSGRGQLEQWRGIDELFTKTDIHEE